MTLKSESGEWYTPIKTLKDMCNRYGFIPILDIAGTPNHNMSPYIDFYYDKKSDSLSQDWTIMMKDKYRSSKNKSYYIEKAPVGVWMNCPTANQQEFLYKFREQWLKLGFYAIVILPVNVMSSDGWWDNIENPKDQGEDISYKPLYHRVPFLFMGEKDSSARNAYISVYFGGRKNNNI